MAAGGFCVRKGYAWQKSKVVAGFGIGPQCPAGAENHKNASKGAILN
jgi:hypothetical protein